MSSEVFQSLRTKRTEKFGAGCGEQKTGRDTCHAAGDGYLSLKGCFYYKGVWRLEKGSTVYMQSQALFAEEKYVWI